VNKKILGLFVSLLAVVMLATPLVQAVPGAPKNNDKFEFFELVCSGTGSGTGDRFWYTPPNADPLDNKTTHGRGMGWITGGTVELTVGEETFTMDTDPYNVTWTTAYDMELIRYNNGTIKRVNIRLTDVVTVYDADNESIGTLVLNLKSTIVPTATPVYSGNVVGYGTGDLAGVHISAIDLGLTALPPPDIIYERNGTITGWPDYITNP